MYRYAFLLLALSLSAGLAPAAEPSPLTEPPAFLRLGTNTGTGVTSMQCTGRAPFASIRCDFTQVGVRRDPDSDFQKARKDLEKRLTDATEQQLLEEIADLKKRIEKGRAVLRGASGWAREKLKYAKRAMANIETLAACSTKPCIVAAMLAQQANDQRTCHISTNAFSASFTQSGPHKWISTQGPQGICHLVLVQTLENEPDYPSLWTFTQTNVTADKGPICDGIELNSPIVFSWQADATLEIDCAFVDFTAF